MYTRAEQLAYDTFYADAICFLPLGTLVLPAMALAPLGVDPVGWMWAIVRTPAAEILVMGWVHPGVIAPHFGREEVID